MPYSVNPSYNVPGGSLATLLPYTPDPNNPLAVGSFGGTPLFGGTQDTPVLDPATGLYHSKKTGAVWTGAVTTPDGTTAKAQNGKLLPADQYGNPLPVFTPITTVKQPDIQSAATGLLGQANDNASMLTKSFNDYLNQANAINAQSKVQLGVDQAAVDPTATINRVNADSAQQNNELQANDQNYADQQQVVQGDVAAENTNASDTTAARLAALKSNLDAENAQYETAAQAVAQQAWAKAQQGLSVYQLGTGTPTSASGNLSNRAIRAYDAINIPLQQDLANRQYTQTEALDQQQQAADEENYQNLMRQYGGTAALNTDLANRTGTTAQYTGNLDASTAQYIQNLKQQTAGMSRAQAATYLQQLNVPIEVGQQILSGQIGNVAQIQNVEAGANYYTLSSPYDPSRVPAAPAFNPSAPTRTYTPASAGTSTWMNTAPGAAAPITPVGQLVDVGGGYQRDQAGNTWLNGQLISQGQPVLPRTYVPPVAAAVAAATSSGAASVDSESGVSPEDNSGFDGSGAGGSW